MTVVALIPAAGMGKRMAAGVNKQYLMLGEMPILAHTLTLFQKARCIHGIYVVVPADEIAYCRETVVERHGFAKVMGLVAGGAERQESVRNGLRAAAPLGDDDLVVIHDGVRPFVTEEILERSIETALRYDGALTAVPVKDTVKTAADGLVTGTPKRESLWLAQTPQTFRHRIIREAHERAERDGFLGTDDASLVERLGGKVRLVMGDYRNIKITTPEDMLLAEAFLKGGAR